MTKTLLTGVALAVLATAALADYPEKPVTFVVPWPPGDLEDVLTRMIAEEFQNRTGAPAGGRECGA
jgi:tripartite-type tricarboxylate transporter receptor subunit TctC